MQKNRHFPLSLLAALTIVGCATVPPENTALNDTRAAYETARNDPQITRFAPLELQDAGRALTTADSASSNREDVATVNHLAYLARQKVAFAQETAKRKAAEFDVANASAKRDQVRLELRTAEADAAKRRSEAAQKTAEQRAALAFGGLVPTLRAFGVTRLAGILLTHADEDHVGGLPAGKREVELRRSEHVLGELPEQVLA